MKKLAKVKVMMRMMRRKRGIFAMLDVNRNRSISIPEMFRPFSAMDINNDLTVSSAEFATFMNKAKRPICFYLKRQAMKNHAQSWI